MDDLPSDLNDLLYDALRDQGLDHNQALELIQYRARRDAARVRSLIAGEPLIQEAETNLRSLLLRLYFGSSEN